jgi:hypothetical protein
MERASNLSQREYSAKLHRLTYFFSSFAERAFAVDESS